MRNSVLAWKLFLVAFHRIITLFYKPIKNPFPFSLNFSFSRLGTFPANPHFILRAPHESQITGHCTSGSFKLTTICMKGGFMLCSPQGVTALFPGENQAISASPPFSRPPLRWRILTSWPPCGLCCWGPANTVPACHRASSLSSFYLSYRHSILGKKWRCRFGGESLKMTVDAGFQKGSVLA